MRRQIGAQNGRDFEKIDQPPTQKKKYSPGFLGGHDVQQANLGLLWRGRGEKPLLLCRIYVEHFRRLWAILRALELWRLCVQK